MNWFDRWKETVKTTGHPDYPFLDSLYSTSSRVPCRGFTEWIAEAFLAGDILSIARLFQAITRPDETMDDKTVIEKFGGLPLALQRAGAETTLSGLDQNRLSLLLSAYMLQATLEGYQREFILIHPGRFLLAASILPWEFTIVDPQKCVSCVNTFIKSMRKETPFWKDVPLYRDENVGPFDRNRTESLAPLLEQLIPLSTASRMHLMDSIRYSGFGSSRRRLEECTFYETRRLGCHTQETAQELRASGLVRPDIDLDSLSSWFKKKELQDVLKRKGIAFKKAANRTALLELAMTHASDELRAKALAEGAFALSDTVKNSSGTLLAFFNHRAGCLAGWVVGEVVPHI